MTPLLTSKEQIKNKIWEGLHIVSSHEIDFKHLLALQNIFGLLQDAAYKHVEARNIGWSDLHKNNQFWMIVKIILKIKRRPEWDEKIKIRTWTTGSDGINANRNWMIFDEKGDEIISGISKWLIVNEKSRKIQKMDKNFLDKHSFSEMPFNYDLNKIPKIQAPEIIASIRAKNSELDINHHINNTNYVKWVFDSEKLNFLSKNEPKEIEINFLKESKAGVEIKVGKKIASNNEMYYGIFNDRHDSARIRVIWRKQRL